MEDIPRYVLASPADATATLRRLARAGWLTRAGFALGEAGWDLTDAKLVLFGRVPDPETVRLAVLAANRGAGIVAIVDDATETARALVAALSRLGPVHGGAGTERPSETVRALSALIPEQRALLERLANGQTIAAAAAAEFLSLRTANRRIAQARALLGVRTTREAVLAYVRQRRPG